MVPRTHPRTGDDGTTGLIGGKRVTKECPRIEAIGSVDELNALIGAVRSTPLPAGIDSLLQRLQDDLFNVGAELARAGEPVQDSRELPAEDIVQLEREIDALEAGLEPLRQFILPGGSTAGAMLHVVRTVARRAERRFVALSKVEEINPNLIRYMNRLSDLCFVLAREVNRQHSKPESHPSFGRHSR